MGYRGAGLLPIYESGRASAEERKRARTEAQRPTPSGTGRGNPHLSGNARDNIHAAPAAYYANGRPYAAPTAEPFVNKGPFPPNGDARRQTQTNAITGGAAPTNPQGHPNSSQQKNEKREATENNTTASPQQQEPPAGENGCSHAALKDLLRRIIALEFSGRCTQRSMAVVQTICDTLCQSPLAVVKVMEVLDECFAEAVERKQQQQILNYWYIVDAVMKLFRERPKMLNAVVVALPHLLLQYVPWKKSKLAEESWMHSEEEEGRYEHLFKTWDHALPRPLLDEIWAFWKDGAGPVETPRFTSAQR
ncbi:hypothetical protein DQ04_16881000 [Trypanosoma grayi]|uniref:hypothetical protein n=1 Tax=Trypanosoma grayi TaxID=71804 RepID=UPI0004F4B7FC|nr:hypothetical protein DQ04_16881000 [Trypanosoma grayi]KEG05973.1 hypothetical protein DQ04_16881000 [Trypanosoma grayi]